MHYIGIDAHRKTCQATVMNDDGQILERNKITTELPELKKFFTR